MTPSPLRRCFDWQQKVSHRKEKRLIRSKTVKPRINQSDKSLTCFLLQDISDEENESNSRLLGLLKHTLRSLK